MTEIRAHAQRVISASPNTVYAYLADHQRHHARFLPPAFSNFQVETGGVGAGTVVSYRLKAAGRNRTYRARIDEPIPGRVLTETLLDSGIVTTFTVAPHPGGSLVVIDTRWEAPRGVRGWLEGRFAPRALCPLYEEELALLDSYAQTRRKIA